MGINREVGLDRIGAFAHADEAKMTVSLGLGFEPHSVVDDIEVNGLCRTNTRKTHGRGTAVTLDVFQRFAGNRHELTFDCMVAVADGLDRERRLDSVHGSQLLHKFAQLLDQCAIGLIRPQLDQDVARLA